MRVPAPPLHSGYFSLTPSSSRVATLLHRAAGRRGGGRWRLMLAFTFPLFQNSPQMILVSSSFAFRLQTHIHKNALFTDHPFLASLHTSPLLPSTSPSEACSHMFVLMSLQFFICSPLSLFPDPLCYTAKQQRCSHK